MENNSSILNEPLYASTPRWQRLALIAILVLFAALSVLYNVSTPLFEGPDEAAHYQYVKYIADGRGLPALGRSPPEVLWEGLQQPPLYYALGAALTSWINTSDLPALLWSNPHRGGETGGVNLYYHTDREDFPYQGTALAVHLVRLLNTCFGLLTVVMTYLAARELLPRQPVFALGAAALVAFNPQFLFTSGTISNDGAIAAFCAVGIWLLLRMFRRNGLTGKESLLLGLVVGLGVIAKPSGLAFLVPCALALALIAWKRRSWAVLLWGGGAIAAGAFLLGGWWYIRNVLLYGDPLAWNAIVAIKAPTLRPEQIPLREALEYSAWMQKSFWGVFANGILMDFSVYRALEVVMRLSALGLIILLVLQVRRRTFDGATWAGLALLFLWSGLVYIALLRFMQAVDATNQGRLLFPAVGALSILLLLGLVSLVPQRFDFIPAAVVCAALVALAVVAPFRYIIPAYAPPPQDQRLVIDTPPAGLPVRFADKIELLNYSITPSEVEPGSVVHVTLDWRALAPMDVSYKLFMHVLGYDGERLTQLDTIPYQGRFATVLWKPGQEFREEYDLFITGKARPSLGRIQLGLFPWNDPGQRLPVFTPDGRPLGDHFELGPFKIGPKHPSQPEIAYPVQADFGPAISLLGYDRSAPVSAGGTFTLTLYWEAKTPIAEDYTVFVHVLDSTGKTVAQQDIAPQHANYPTSIWGAGELVVDPHTLELPASLPAGDYTLAVGLYLP